MRPAWGLSLGYGTTATKAANKISLPQTFVVPCGANLLGISTKGRLEANILPDLNPLSGDPKSRKN